MSFWKKLFSGDRAPVSLTPSSRSAPTKIAAKQQKQEADAPLSPAARVHTNSVTPVSPSSPTPAIGQKYWKCPNCGATHDKGLGSAFADLGFTVAGTVTCYNCNTQYSQTEVIQGKFDTEQPGDGHRLHMVETNYEFFVGERAATWGSGHNVAFGEEYTAVELRWLLDGIIFPVSNSLTKAECQKFVEENFPAAVQVALRSSVAFNLPKPKPEYGYMLAITKLKLSYAVRNNVHFRDAENAFKRAMGWDGFAAEGAILRR